ncbi:MAG TPA: hypothetical protein VGT99_13285 [Gammaproteobacteria bacterium]|nr:hypothetical protein [Gammaproteobacteria bacterium]
MAQVNAWILDMGGVHQAAISERELFHVLYEPRFHRLPRTQAHCDRLIEWEGLLLPVWDLRRWVHTADEPDRIRFVAVVGYTGDDGQTGFGGIALGAPPVRIMADDADACLLPDDAPRWQEIAAACFARGGVRVPVLDLARMFLQPVRTVQ